MGNRAPAHHKRLGAFVTALEPTDTEPGSEARIRIYRERVENGLEVFHPKDSAPPITADRWREVALGMDIGDRLLYLMRRATISGPSALAEQSGVQEDTIRDFMRGKRNLVFMDADRIAETLGVEQVLLTTLLGVRNGKANDGSGQENHGRLLGTPAVRPGPKRAA